MSIEKILIRANEHLLKAANASLTQHKMATNNFEISSIINDLPGMLRGFGIEVQSKPAPNLELDDADSSITQGGAYAPRNIASEYYQNNGLDFSRQNDIDMIESRAEELKVIQTSAGLPTTYPESRMNELTQFQSALRENNARFSSSITNSLLQEDLKAFGKQFSELEIFVAGIEDFSNSLVSMIGEM